MDGFVSPAPRLRRPEPRRRCGASVPETYDGRVTVLSNQVRVARQYALSVATDLVVPSEFGTGATLIEVDRVCVTWLAEVERPGVPSGSWEVLSVRVSGAGFADGEGLFVGTANHTWGERSWRRTDYAGPSGWLRSFVGAQTPERAR